MIDRNIKCYLLAKQSLLILICFLSTNLLAQQYSIDFSTFIGGSSNDYPRFMEVVDSETYLLSYVSSSDFSPITDGSTFNANRDMVLTKYDAANNVVFSTHLGSNGYDYPTDLKIEGDNVFVLSQTYGGTTFPVTDGSTLKGSSDVVFSRLNGNTGVLEFATYLGSDGLDEGISLVCENGIIYLAAITDSDNFPVTDGSTRYTDEEEQVDLVLIKMDSSANIDFATYVGPYSTENFGNIYMEILNGEAYFALMSDYDYYPVTDGSVKTHDGAVVVHKLDNTGQTVYAAYLLQELTAEETYFRAEFDNGIFLLLTEETEGNINQSVITDGTIYQNGRNSLFMVVDANNGEIAFATYPALSDVKQLVLNGEVWLIGESDNETHSFIQYDKNQEVIISTSFSGTDILSTFIDSNGIYLLSNPKLNDLPTTDGSVRMGTSDIAFTKLNHEGQIQTLSYIGGEGSNYPLNLKVEDDIVYFATQIYMNTGPSTYPITDGSSSIGLTDVYYAKLDLCPSFPESTVDTLSPSKQMVCQNGLIQQIKGVPIAISGKDLPTIYRAGIPFNQNDIAAFYQWQESLNPTGSWSDIAGATQVNYSPQPVVANRYFRRLSFNSECCGKDTISISQVDSILVNSFVAPVVDAGGVFNTCPNVDVTLDATISGGTAPFNYDWDMGAADIEDPTVAPLESTVFTLIVTDNNDCQQLGQAVVNTYTANAGPETAGACAGDPILIGGTPIPGVPGVVYDWTPTTNLSCTDCAEPYANPTVSTTYDLELTIPITGGGTCTTNDQIQAIPITAPTNPDFAGPDITICRGDLGALGTSAEYFPILITNVTQTSTSGGFAGTVVNLTDSDFSTGARTNNESSASITMDLGRIYSNIARVEMAAITAANLNGRRIQISTDNTIWQTVNYGINGATNNSLTAYDFFKRDARYIRILGVGTTIVDLSEIIVYQTFAYTWAPGNYLVYNNRAETTFKPGSLALPAPDPILYYITAEREGCTFTDEVLAHVIEARAWVDGCGPRTVGEADRTPNIEETYEWVKISGPGNFTGPTNIPQTTVSESIGSDTEYEVRVSHGGTTCTDRVIVPPTCGCVVDITVAAPNSCASVTLNEGGDVVLTASGSTSPNIDPTSFTYTWSVISGPAGGLSSFSGTTVTLTDEIERTYRVTFESSENPSISCTRDISVNDPAWSLPVFNATDVSVCGGSPIQIGEPSVTDYTYAWLPETNLNQADISMPTATVDTDSEYKVEVTDTRSGCTVIDTVEIQTLSVTADAGEDILLCDNGVITIGGKPAQANASYAWTPINANWQNGTDETDAQPEALVGINQEFTLTVTSNPGNCISKDTMMVTVGTPMTPFSLSDISYCPSDGAVTLGSSVPAGLSFYDWKPASLLVDANIQSPSTNNPPPSTETTFTVLVRNSSGCEYQTTQKIIPSISTPDAGSSKIICLGESTTIGNSSNPSGAGINYTWTGSATGELSSTSNPNPTFTPSSGGVFEFTLSKDDNGCISTATVTITVNEYVLPAIAPITICQGAAQQIGTTAEVGVQYFWSPTTNLSDSTIANPIVSGLTTTTSYTLTAIGLNGCATTADVLVGVNPVPAPEIILNDTIICFGETTTAFNPIISPAGNYNYVWSPNDGSVADIYDPQSEIYIFGIGEKSYTLQVTDTDSGCGANATTKLLVTTGCDWGDLPDTSGGFTQLDYQTLRSNNGPVHIITSGLSLGSDVDGEVDGQPNDTALGDGTDENGLTIFSSTDIHLGGTLRMPFSYINTTGNTAYLEIWIDWNGDGDFDELNEMIFDGADNNGNTPFQDYLEVSIPTDAVTGTYLGMRLRLSHQDNMTPYGRMESGEVEDYLIGIDCPQIICIPLENALVKREE